MYARYHDGLIETIKTNINVEVHKYFGELEDPGKGEFLKGSLPLIYVDFIEDDTSAVTTIDLKFSLYIIHISYSKNKKIRSNTQSEIYDLLKDIYKQLLYQDVEDSQPLELGKLKKIYDASASGGYLSVYRKDISMAIPNPLLIGE